MVSGVCTAWSSINICKRVKKQFRLAGKRITSKTTMSAWAHASFYNEFAEFTIWEEHSSTSLSLYIISEVPETLVPLWCRCLHQNTLVWCQSNRLGMLTYVGLGWCRRRKKKQSRVSHVLSDHFLLAPRRALFGCAALSDEHFLEWISPVYILCRAKLLTNPVLHKKKYAASVWKFEKPSKHRLQLEAFKFVLLSISHDPYQQIIKCLNTNIFLV